eukprot:3473277-Alexandrium_andersonii.AAC.1
MSVAPPSARFGFSLDTQKAFDNTHPELVGAVFAHLGLRPELLRPVLAQWRQQRRWATFAGR